MTIRGLSGYATLTSPLGNRKEADTFTCGHCQKIIHVTYKIPLDQLGGRCTICDTLICPECIKTGMCDPFEKKLQRMEAVKRYIGIGAIALVSLCGDPAHAARRTFHDLICETSTTSGTGTMNLAGAFSLYLTFGSQVGTGEQVSYNITSGDGKFETGVGTFTDSSPDTLSRTSEIVSTDGVGTKLSLTGTSVVCLGQVSTLIEQTIPTPLANYSMFGGM